MARWNLQIIRRKSRSRQFYPIIGTALQCGLMTSTKSDKAKVWLPVYSARFWHNKIKMHWPVADKALSFAYRDESVGSRCSCCLFR